MGFIRTAIITALSILLLLSFFLMAITLTLSWSLEYDTIKPELQNSINELASEEFGLNEIIGQEINLMQMYCMNNTKFVIEEEGYILEIPCNIVGEGSEAIIDYGINSVIEKIYYQEYNCDFWKCVKETNTPFVLLSEKARSYWKSKFHFFLLTSLAIATLIFFTSKRKHTVLLLSGILLILSVLPLVKISLLFSNPLIPNSLTGIIEGFFTRSFNVFLIFSIIGLFIFLFSMALHFFDIGKRMSNWFTKNKESVSSDDIKNIVHNEISKKSKKGEIAISHPEEKPKKHISIKEIKKIVKEEIVKKEINKKYK